MGTPHVHCMSQLPTAHEPADHAADPLGDRQRPRGHSDGAAPYEDRVTKSGCEVSYER
jgi:hypothetical protein